MFKLNLFIILTFLCVKAISFDMFDLVNETAEDFEEVVGNLLEAILTLESDTNGTKSTGTAQEEAENKDGCTGGLFDFIHCVVRAKIESFRQELSNIVFPNQPEHFELQTMDNKIEGSLEDWIQKIIQHSGVHNENSTLDK